VLLTDREHEEIRAAASGPGRGVSLSRFVAEAALAAARHQPVPTPSRAPSRLALAEIADAVVAVNRVGNNLNQLARERNVTGERPRASRMVEERVLAALVRLTAVVDRAGGCTSADQAQGHAGGVGDGPQARATTPLTTPSTVSLTALSTINDVPVDGGVTGS
jgi:hypothetical protein